MPTRTFSDSRIYKLYIYMYISRRSRSRWPPSKNMRWKSCPGKENQESYRERECTGWKATGKAFFHMLIHEAGCAHEYLWSKRAFLSLPSFSLSFSATIFTSFSFSLIVYTCCLKIFTLSLNRK